MHKPRAKRGSQLYQQLFKHPKVIDLSESKMEEREFRICYVRGRFYIVLNRVLYC